MRRRIQKQPPLVTLTTDFGWEDAYVAEIRIIRHGITQGYSTDAGLTPMGGWQAHQRGHALAKTLREWPKMRIVCADTNRARQTAERRGHVQPLLVPIVLRLAPAAAARVAESSTELAAIGVEIEPFGAGSIAIKALPGPLASLHENALASLLAELSQELEGFGRGESLDHRRDALLARAACHASVRANDSLAEDEAQALIAALDATDFGARCAHGRPVVAPGRSPCAQGVVGADEIWRRWPITPARAVGRGRRRRDGRRRNRPRP